MSFNTKFSLRSFLKQVTKLTDNQKESIERAGFGNLLRIPDHVLRRSQLDQLMEKWSCEKQAFIFPPGEITITLLDVALILGLRVIGQPVVLELLAPLTSLEKEFGASVVNRTIGVELLKERLESVGDRDDESFVRVFLLYCFGTLLFPSANGKVDSRYLHLLQDVDNVSSFAWGAAVLEDLNNCLRQRKSKKTNNIGGCLILLQIWCYEHIITGRPKLLDYPTFPRVCRWESSARQYAKSSQFNINFEELEHTQILWKLEPTSEEMEIDMIREIPQEWHLRSGPGTIEQPIEVENQSAIRMGTKHNEEVDEEEEEEEEPMSGEESAIYVTSDEWHLRSGPGTIKQPIEVQSQSAIRMGTKRNEEVGEEEGPVSREESILFVLSDGEESKEIEDLKKEILELKTIIEEKKENEAKIQAENEELKKRVQDDEYMLMKMEKHISELGILLSKLSMQ
ncbi:putative protein-serine/threonine phosphatase [Helianthus anomalus]